MITQDGVPGTLDNRTLVSVCVLTYNHAQYIRQCLASVLSQQVDFDLEVVVADDASTDGTREKVEAIASSDARIRLLPLARNLGVKRNFSRLLHAARGRYIAIIEGDDYWLGSNKLAIQCAALSANENAVLSFAGVKTAVSFLGIWRESNERLLDEETVKSIPTLLRKGWFGANTCTYVVTASFLEHHLASPFFNPELTSGDWPLVMHASLCGQIIYTPERLGVYRVTPGSLMNSGKRSRINLLVQQVQWWRIFSSNGVEGIDWESVERRFESSRRNLGLREDPEGEIVLFNGRRFRSSRLLFVLHSARRTAGLLVRWVLRRAP